MAEITVYTNSFPYGTSETFLGGEIRQLARAFSSVFIMPAKKAAGIRELPENVTVLPELQRSGWPVPIVYLTGIIFIGRLLRSRDLLKRRGGTSFLKAIRYFGYAMLVRRSLLRNLRHSSDLHYTYWLSYSTFALSELRREGLIKKLVSRTHGYDLYEERGEKALHFLRRATLKHTDRVFCISQHGLDYLGDRYPEWKDRYILSRLGSADPGAVNPVSDRGDLVLVSCSSVDPNKRIDLILAALLILASSDPELSFTWHHFGTGRDLGELREKASAGLGGTKIGFCFHGYVSHDELMYFYRNTGVDLFINVSRSEGIPVSVMEALSFSIPVVVTSSGGVTEIAGNDNGLIMENDISPAGLAGILKKIREGKGEWMMKRSLSRLTWEQKCNEETNYRYFAETLAELAVTGPGKH